jgi:cyclophilin family peptidyl-prolyl cis-trans isomerase
MQADYPSLDGKYSVFGEVRSGMDVVDRIVAVPRDARDRPRENVTIHQIKVVTL